METTNVSFQTNFSRAVPPPIPTEDSASAFAEKPTEGNLPPLPENPLPEVQNAPSSFKFLYFLIPILVILTTGFLTFYLVNKQKTGGANLATTGRSQAIVRATPTSSTPSPGFFFNKGWENKQVFVGDLGRSISMNNIDDENSFMYLVKNMNEKAWFIAKSDAFEISFQVVPGAKSEDAKRDNYYWGIHIDNETNSNQLTLSLRSNTTDNSFQTVIGGQTKTTPFVDLAKGVLPKNGDFSMKFSSNTFSLIEKSTQKEIAHAKLPYDFAKKDNRYQFTFEIGSGLNDLSFKNFEIL